MTINPCISLSFDGQCEAAFKFYERHLGGTLGMLLTWGDSPMAKDAPPAWGSKVLHASLTIGSLVFAGCDVIPGQYESPRGFGVLLGVSQLTDAERIFSALAETGTVRFPLQETFWALRYGSVKDQFGVPWEINCERPA